MTASPNIDQLPADQLRALTAQLLTPLDMMGKRIHRDQKVIENRICLALAELFEALTETRCRNGIE
ncbi:hypothetical protein HP532_26310 [Pseudomonas sp. CrR25]|nr:hypothetical protein [Pseudomonas sp. CrR25]